MTQPNTDSWLIFAAPTERRVQIQLYHALFQIEAFRTFSALLQTEKATLDAYNYELAGPDLQFIQREEAGSREPIARMVRIKTCAYARAKHAKLPYRKRSECVEARAGVPLGLN